MSLPNHDLANSSSPNEQILSRQVAQQFQVEINMLVPACWRMNRYDLRLSKLFMENYKKEPLFQMTLQGLGTDTWHLIKGPRGAQQGLSAQKLSTKNQGRPDALSRRPWSLTDMQIEYVTFISALLRLATT